VVEAEEVEAVPAPVPEPNPTKAHPPAAGAPNAADVGAAEAVAPKRVAAPVAEPKPPPAGAPNAPDVVAAVEVCSFVSRKPNAAKTVPVDVSSVSNKPNAELSLSCKFSCCAEGRGSSSSHRGQCRCSSK